MSRPASDAMALEQRISDLERRKTDFMDMRDFVDKYNLNAKFPEFADYIRSQTEILSRDVADLISTVANPPRKEPVYEVSAADAAAALGVSEQTVRNWDQNGCPFDPNYPGRFNAIIFYQWAKTFSSLQNFRREAKKRAILMNKPA